MRLSNLNKILERTVFIQITAVWTGLVALSYFISETWLRNNLLTHVLFWILGGAGLWFVLTKYYKFRDKDKKIEMEGVSSVMYHALVETSPDSVAVTDLFGNYIYVNKQTAILHGFENTEDFIGKSAFGLFSMSDVAKAAKYMEITRSDGIIKNVEFNLLKKDGTSFPAELSAALVKNEFGIPAAFIAITRDITERKQIADQIQDMNERLRFQLVEIEKLQYILKEQAIQDPLTGLYNRRFMEESLKQEFARASRENKPFSIVMMDMDNLKALNDTYGHSVGDMAIKSLARLLRTLTRTEDIVCRYGGDEFLVILHNADEHVAAAHIREWNERAEGVRVSPENPGARINFSSGAATFPNHKSMEDLIFAADMALYEMKAERKRKS